jgi:hypothetical protein
MKLLVSKHAETTDGINALAQGKTVYFNQFSLQS